MEYRFYHINGTKNLLIANSPWLRSKTCIFAQCSRFYIGVYSIKLYRFPDNRILGSVYVYYYSPSQERRYTISPTLNKNCMHCDIINVQQIEKSKCKQLLTELNTIAKNVTITEIKLKRAPLVV